MGTATNVILELEKSIASITTNCDQSLGEAEKNKVVINRNSEEIESLKLKALEYEKSLENMEAIKVDFATKQKVNEDHNSLIKEVDKVWQKKKVQEAHFPDIDREVNLLKIQIQEEKKLDISSQSLKKGDWSAKEPDCPSGGKAGSQDGTVCP